MLLAVLKEKVNNSVLYISNKQNVAKIAGVIVMLLHCVHLLDC